MKLNLILSLSLSLALASCQQTAPLLSQNPAINQQQTLKASQPIQAKIIADGVTETLKVNFKLPGRTGFGTQYVSENQIAFVRLSIRGEGLSGTRSSGLIAVSGNAVTATLSGIPLSSGNLRVVTVEAFDADENEIAAFEAKATYTSSSDTTVEISVERRYYLLGAMLANLLSNNPTLIDLIDLSALQSELETMTGFDTTRQTFVSDPLMYDIQDLVDQIGIDGTFPDAATLSAASLLDSSDASITLTTADSLPLGEQVRIIVNDPSSKPVIVRRLSASGESYSLTGIAPGSWVLDVQNESGESLGQTTVTVDGSGDAAILGSSNLELSDIALARGEFLVNTYTDFAQNSPEIAIDEDGDFVIVWDSGDQDGSLSGVYAQRYNSLGVAQGSEFLVNTYTSGNQNLPSVAMDADGDFVIAWQSKNQDNAAGKYAYGVYAQRYTSLGVAQGSEFRVNSYTTNAQREPAVAMDADGDFVIAWEDGSQQDGDDYGIYAQRYSSTGAVLGSEFLVNTQTANNQRDPEIAINATGGFVISWTSSGQDGSETGIYAQRYNSSGVAQGSEFQVNTYTGNQQTSSSIAINDDGGYVITWNSGLGQDGNGYGVYAQRFDSSGNTQGSEFRVNTYTTGDQGNPLIGIDDEGDFVITWIGSNQDGDLNGIYAQRYNATGQQLAQEFLANTYITGHQSNPAIAVNKHGSFVIVWGSENGQDGSNSGIYFQRYNAFGQPL